MPTRSCKFPYCDGYAPNICSCDGESPYPTTNEFTQAVNQIPTLSGGAFRAWYDQNKKGTAPIGEPAKPQQLLRLTRTLNSKYHR